jgi:hypothetical protein
MTRFALAAPIAILAVVLAGCSSSPRTPQVVSVQPAAQPYMAGTGVVQDVRPAPAPMIAGPASAAGPTAAAPSGMQRLTIRMDTGRVIYVDTPSNEFQKGQRVQLTEANEIRRM